MRMKAPSSKFQIPKKLQISSSNPWPRGRHWNLELGISLELGVWDLEFLRPALVTDYSSLC